MATTAERQRRARERAAERGLFPVSVMLPSYAAPDLRDIARALVECHERGEPFTFGPIRSLKSGKLVSVKRS